MNGCAHTPDKLQVDAGARIGQAAAGVELERQPEECGQSFPLLDVPIGQELTTVWRRYEDYVQGPINGRIVRCYLFNESQAEGLRQGAL